MSFTDKVVLVTGASSGIGAAVAVKFVKEGAKVALVGRNEKKLSNVVQKCVENGSKPLVVIADLSTEADVKKVVEMTYNQYKKIDVLVNNAGIGSFESILGINAMKEFDKVMNVNLRVPVYLTHLASAYLIESHGCVVNISSIASTGIFVPNNFTYCTSKAALDHFSRSVALEFTANGVRVNTINPGPVKTDFSDDLIPEKSWDAMKQRTALGKISEPDEIADLVLYLASEKAKSITGSSHGLSYHSSIISNLIIIASAVKM